MTKTLCGAKTRSGGKCKQPAMPNGKCRLHGGKSLSGVAHPNYQGKGFSKYIPIGLIDTFNEFRADPEKLVMDEQIAIVDTYMAQLLESLGDYSSPELWEQLQAQVVEYRKAKDDERPILLAYILELIEAGASYVSKWDTLHKALEQRRKLVADERKRRIEAEQVITVEQAMLIVTGLLESVRRNVSDRDILMAIQLDFITLTTTQKQPVLTEDAV